MNEMIEKVQTALYAAAAKHGDPFDEEDPLWPEMACAAIEAMRDLTTAEAWAGGGMIFDLTGGAYGNDMALAIYRAMIDTALSTKEIGR